MNAVSTYDFTSFVCGVEETKKLLKQYCKRWDFQQEETKTGEKHLQGRFHLKVKERIGGVMKKFPGFHLTITSEANIKNNYYVTKEDSRIDGPWSSDDKEKYIPRQIREINQLKPWQQHIVADGAIWNTRTINIIIDSNGNIGKTTLCTYCGVHGYGRKIPFSNDFRDIMRMVMDTPTSQLYLFDIPRALKKDHLYQFFAGIEEIKNGYAYDDRYSFREKYFDCPNIWIFMNIKPDTNYLSPDRWKFWTVENDNLIELREAPEEIIEDELRAAAEAELQNLDHNPEIILEI